MNYKFEVGGYEMQFCDDLKDKVLDGYDITKQEA
jgi:hypothetical protein